METSTPPLQRRACASIVVPGSRYLRALERASVNASFSTLSSRATVPRPSRSTSASTVTTPSEPMRS